MKAIARILILTSIACVLLLVVYRVLIESGQARQIAELESLNADMARRLAEKEAMLERLSRTRRVAHIEVEHQTVGEDGEIRESVLKFIELDDDGAELARQTMTVPGNVLFVDTWTAKFGAEDVALGHPLRGRTLVLFRRVYSDHLAPRDGIAIDTPGAIPPGYAAGPAGQFEKVIWQRFWEIASDADLAREFGVRVAQGEAVYRPVRAGQTYELIVDAAGGINLTPLSTLDARRTQVDE